MTVEERDARLDDIRRRRKEILTCVITEGVMYPLLHKAACEDVPWLLEEVVRLEKQVAEYEQQANESHVVRGPLRDWHPIPNLRDDDDNKDDF